MEWNIPNVLTAARVVAIPFFIVASVLNKHKIANYIFIGASITDYIDGYLARKWKLESPFGEFMDPVADKLMVTAALIVLVTQNTQWWFTGPVIIIISREIAVSALREWMANRKLRSVVKVGSLGKWKTALQMVAIAFMLEAAQGDEDSVLSLTALLRCTHPIVFHTGLLSMYAATVLTVVSGYYYFAAAWKDIVSVSKQ